MEAIAKANTTSLTYDTCILKWPCSSSLNRCSSPSSKARIAAKIEAEYRDLTQLPAALAAQQGASRPGQGAASSSVAAPQRPQNGQAGVKRKMIEGKSQLYADANRRLTLFILPPSTL